MIGGRGGVYLAPKSRVLPAEPGASASGPSFLRDRTYVRIGVRSDLTLEVHEMLWLGHANT
jgi:hypothetical protein